MSGPWIVVAVVFTACLASFGRGGWLLRKDSKVGYYCFDHLDAAVRWFVAGWVLFFAYWIAYAVAVAS